MRLRNLAEYVVSVLWIYSGGAFITFLTFYAIACTNCPGMGAVNYMIWGMIASGAIFGTSVAVIIVWGNDNVVAKVEKVWGVWQFLVFDIILVALLYNPVSRCMIYMVNERFSDYPLDYRMFAAAGTTGMMLVFFIPVVMVIGIYLMTAVTGLIYALIPRKEKSGGGYAGG